MTARVSLPHSLEPSTSEGVAVEDVMEKLRVEVTVDEKEGLSVVVVGASVSLVDFGASLVAMVLLLDIVGAAADVADVSWEEDSVVVSVGVGVGE